VITPLACSLVGQQQWVEIHPGTRASSLYGAARAEEDYYCNYGVEPSYRNTLEEGGLTVSGTGASGEVRMIELAEHPFFMATLFLPQTRSTASSPHPLIAGYATAVRARR